MVPSATACAPVWVSCDFRTDQSKTHTKPNSIHSTRCADTIFTSDMGHRYEGEFMQGWFHGHGIFWRSDGMKFEGEFRGGRIWGLGLITFSDLTNGFPRNEGFFQDCRLLRKKRCPEVVQRAQKIALMARAQCDELP